MSNVLTFDLGTSYFKVCLFDHACKLLCRHHIPAPVEHPAPDRSELPVAAFVDSIAQAVREIGRQAGALSNVDSICFASQANTFTLLDENDQALMPFLLWCDARAQQEPATGLERLVSRPDFYRTTGIAELNYLFMPAKLLWLRDRQPQILQRTRRLCSLADYLVYWLTGNHLSEASLAGLTGLADIHRLQWWPDAAQIIELPTEWLPPIIRAGSDAGQLTAKRVKSLGLAKECRLTMGCLDQFAGAIGAGNVTPGGVSETTGTVLATVRRDDQFTANAPAGVYQGPASVPGDFFQMVFSGISANLLERYRNELPDKPSFAELDQLVAQVPAGAEGLQLHPSASEQPDAEMFVGRTVKHGRGHEVRAIMEAVAYELRRQVTCLCGNDWPTSIQAAGGAARSAAWLKIKSEILGCPVQGVSCEEPTSLGAARLVRSNRAI